jgi:hypothetical protein
MSDPIKATVTAILNALVSSGDDHVEIQLQLDGRHAFDLRISGQFLLEFIEVLHFVAQRAEAERDKIAAQGQTTPLPCLPIRETALIEAFQPDRKILRVFFHNNSWLDSSLSLEHAQTLRDQLDASLAAASVPPPSAKH